MFIIVIIGNILVMYMNALEIVMKIVITVSLKKIVPTLTQIVCGMKIHGLTNTMIPTTSIITVFHKTMTMMIGILMIKMIRRVITTGMEPNGYIVELDSCLHNSHPL